MTESHSSSLAPFAWVCKRDGQLVPFEADKISRALFAATESLGRPDAFLARELTDSILHFLAADAGDAPPTTAALADLVVKVVRELGQPALAQAFEDFDRQRERNQAKDEIRRMKEAAEPSDSSFILHPSSLDLRGVAEWVEQVPPPMELLRRSGEALLRAYSLRHVFARDLVAAQADGLLTLTGLETPLELAGGVLPLGARQHQGVLEAIEEARQWAGNFVALDGPEYGLADAARTDQATAQFARELRLGLRLTQLRAVVNLNGQVPPAWADELAEGPLFVGKRRVQTSEGFPALAESVLEQVLLAPPSGIGVRVDWHLGERDFLPATAARLVRLTRLALNGTELAFVFDRPRRAVSLAEGTDRRHPGVLLAVRLHLPRLAELPGLSADPGRFLQKLGSLVRLAISAAVQKRDFLRRHSQHRPGMTRGFLLERARLVLTPMGLEQTACRLVGEGWSGGGAGVAFIRQVIQQLEACVRQDGPVCQLEGCLDHCPLRPEDPGLDGLAPCGSDLVPWESLVAPKKQLPGANPLHAVAALGTVGVLIPNEDPPTAEEAAQLLGYAWQHTDVVRIRFLHVRPRPQQLTAPWALETTRPGDEG